MLRLRHYAIWALLLGAACGGSTPTNPVTPPPAAPGAPASIAIVTGDGQSAAAGSTLPVALSVLVKDAAGTPVPGVLVHFAVDSGGGTLAVPSAATGSNGVAMGGSWTLGSGAGVTNVVSATVSGLAAARFHATALGIVARTLFNNITVGGGGGTFHYTSSSDGLSGLTLTVPAGSYTGSTQWTIVADSTIAVPLPVGFSQVGPVLVLTNGQDYADSVITLTMPMHLASGMAVAPFFFDPVSHTLEGVPMVAQSSTSATLASRHFSGDLMAIPGSGASTGSLRRSLRAGFGSVEIVWVQAPTTTLQGTFTTTFLPGFDDWEFINEGDYISPGGICEGMSVTAMYYHYFFRLGPSPRPPLFHRFDTSLADQWDNVGGIRFAGSVQGDVAESYQAGLNQVAALTDSAMAHGVTQPSLTSTWLLLTLKLTGRPVLLTLFGPPGGHAVVAYGATTVGSTTTVSFADPNFPGNTTRTLTYFNGILQPVALSVIASDPPGFFQRSYAVGVSAEVPLNQVGSRWQEFAAGKAGSDRYPASYHFEIFDPIAGTWSTLGATFQTTATTVQIRTICPDCPYEVAGGAPNEQEEQIWDAAGQNALSLTGELSGVNATTQFMAVAYGLSPFDPKRGAGFLDSQIFTFIHGTFFIIPATPTPSANAPVSFVAKGGVATANSTYTWNFGDVTPPVVVTGDSNVNHTYAATGSFTVIVDLRDGSGVLRGQASLPVSVQPGATFTMGPTALNANPLVAATMTAVPHGTPPAHVNYRWDFGDGFAPVTIKDVATVQHTWTTTNAFPVSLTVLDSANINVIGQATNTACVGAAWRITAFNVQVSDEPDPAAPAQTFAAFDSLDVYLEQIAATPSDGLLYLGDGTFFPERGVYFQVAPPGTGAAGACWLRGGYLTQVARVLGAPSTYLFSGSVTNGQVSGTAYTALTIIPAGVGNTFYNTITAGISGRQMTGTVAFTSFSYGGNRTYNFVATLVGQ